MVSGLWACVDGGVANHQKYHCHPTLYLSYQSSQANVVHEGRSLDGDDQHH